MMHHDVFHDDGKKIVHYKEQKYKIKTMGFLLPWLV
jgi:hypothetical protein